MMPIIESQAQRDALIERCKKYVALHESRGFIGAAEDQCALIHAIALSALEDLCCLPTDEELKMLREGEFCAEELWGVGGVKSCPKCHNKKFPPVPVLKPVVMPKRISNIDLRSPLEVEDMYRHFMLAAIREAGYPVVGEDFPKDIED